MILSDGHFLNLLAKIMTMTKNAIIAARINAIVGPIDNTPCFILIRFF